MPYGCVRQHRRFTSRGAGKRDDSYAKIWGVVVRSLCEREHFAGAYRRGGRNSGDGVRDPRSRDPVSLTSSIAIILIALQRYPPSSSSSLPFSREAPISGVSTSWCIQSAKYLHNACLASLSQRLCTVSYVDASRTFRTTWEKIYNIVILRHFTLIHWQWEKIFQMKKNTFF